MVVMAAVRGGRVVTAAAMAASAMRASTAVRDIDRRASWDSSSLGLVSGCPHLLVGLHRHAVALVVAGGDVGDHLAAGPEGGVQ